MSRFKKTRKCTYNLGYHIIWCTKYRRSFLVDKIADRLKSILISSSIEIEADIKSIEIMPDHVHVFIKANPELSPHLIVKKYKGVSSNLLRKEFDILKKRLPCLWTRSYFCESVGSISEVTIKRYIENQKNK